MIIAISLKLKYLDYSPLIKLNGKPIKRVLNSDYLDLLSMRDYHGHLT